MEISVNRPVMQVVQSLAPTAVTPGQAETPVGPATVEAAHKLQQQEHKHLADQSERNSEAGLKPDAEELEEAVESMQETVNAIQRNLSFTVDDSSGRTVVEVKDMASGEVIRQLPSEQALKLAESLDEMRSLLFEAQA